MTYLNLLLEAVSNTHKPNALASGDTQFKPEFQAPEASAFGSHDFIKGL